MLTTSTADPCGSVVKNHTGGSSDLSSYRHALHLHHISNGTQLNKRAEHLLGVESLPSSPNHKSPLVLNGVLFSGKWHENPVLS